jgi:hypothetical protein
MMEVLPMITPIPLAAAVPIRVSYLIFRAFLGSFLTAYYTYKFNFVQLEQRNMYDVHIINIIGNMLLLQSLILNRTAMTYWGRILRRWRNNRAPCLRGAIESNRYKSV